MQPTNRRTTTRISTSETKRPFFAFALFARPPKINKIDFARHRRRIRGRHKRRKIIGAYDALLGHKGPYKPPPLPRSRELFKAPPRHFPFTTLDGILSISAAITEHFDGENCGHSQHVFSEIKFITSITPCRSLMHSFTYLTPETNPETSPSPFGKEIRVIGRLVCHTPSGITTFFVGHKSNYVFKKKSRVSITNDDCFSSGNKFFIYRSSNTLPPLPPI